MADQNPKYDFPSDLVEKLRCYFCKNYMSCGPIKVNVDGATMCGRCSSSSSDWAVRHTLLETVMSEFVFPCRYKSQGCEKRFPFGDVAHESTCSYRTFACPALPQGSCTKSLSMFDVYKHFEETHGDLIIKDEKFKLDLQVDSQSNLMVKKDELVVVVQCCYEAAKKILHLNVGYISDDDQGLSYQWQIVHGADANRTIGFKDHPCRRYDCDAIDQECSRSFFMGNYLPALENPSFVVIKIILERSANSATPVQSVPLVSREEKILSVWNSLESIRCYECHSFCVPPVYKTKAYVYCNECKTSLKLQIPEQPVTIANFPCQWRGCSFVGNESSIREHVDNCQFRTVICPLSSCLKGFYVQNAVKKHVLEHGAKFFPKGDRIVMELFFTGPENSACKEYFTKIGDELVAFTCNIEKVNNEYLWQLTVGKIKSAFDADVYFEHNHCTFKSQTFPVNVPGSNRSVCKSTSYENLYPQCFKSCKCIWAVLKIKQK